MSKYVTLVGAEDTQWVPVYEIDDNRKTYREMTKWPADGSAEMDCDRRMKEIDLPDHIRFSTGHPINHKNVTREFKKLLFNTRLWRGYELSIFPAGTHAWNISLKAHIEKTDSLWWDERNELHIVEMAGFHLILPTSEPI